MWLWHGKQWVTKQTWCQEFSFQCWKSRCNCDIWWTRNQGYDVVVRNSYLQETKCIICIIYWSKEQLKGETPMNVWETRVNCVIELLWLCSYLSWFPDGIRISTLPEAQVPIWMKQIVMSLLASAFENCKYLDRTLLDIVQVPCEQTIWIN